MAKVSPSSEPNPVALTYEDALSELERLVAAMEGGQLPLDQLLDNYRRGAELLAFCRARLEAVEQPGLPAEDSDLPAQWQWLADKCRSIVSPLLGAPAAEAVIAAVAGLDERTRVADVLGPGVG